LVLFEAMGSLSIALNSKRESEISLNSVKKYVFAQIDQAFFLKEENWPEKLTIETNLKRSGSLIVWDASAYCNEKIYGQIVNGVSTIPRGLQ
jgi:hypothetical protein